MEGDDIRVGRDEPVIIYFACGVVKSAINVVRWWDTWRVRVGDVDDFHSATNIPVSLTGCLEVDNLVDSAKSSRSDAALHKIPVSNSLPDEGGFGIGSVQEIRRSGERHDAAGVAGTKRTFGYPS